MSNTRNLNLNLKPKHKDPEYNKILLFRQKSQLDDVCFKFGEIYRKTGNDMFTNPVFLKKVDELILRVLTYTTKRKISKKPLVDILEYLDAKKVECEDNRILLENKKSGNLISVVYLRMKETKRLLEYYRDTGDIKIKAELIKRGVKKN